MQKTFTVSNSEFALTKPIYYLLIINRYRSKQCGSVENRPQSGRARRRCIRVLNVGWINVTQNNVQSLYFTISRRLRAVVKADGCITKY